MEACFRPGYSHVEFLPFVLVFRLFVECLRAWITSLVLKAELASIVGAGSLIG